jgi:glycosyltransferase involved in cell wall biosynthesis
MNNYDNNKMGSEMGTSIHENENSFGAGSITCPEVSIIIPVYNEEIALPIVLDTIYKIIDSTYEVIVVDDGSTDNTKAAATVFPCHIVSHDHNRGKGAAIKTGVKHSSGPSIIIIDGDATYPVDMIPQISAYLKQYDVVRCVRKKGRENIPLVNRLGNNIFEKAIGFLHGIDSTDFMSGLYGIRRCHLQQMFLESDGFDIETEIAIKAKSLDLRCSEIPIHYYERLGDKKLKPFQDGLKILARMTRLALSYNPLYLFIVPGLFLGITAIIFWLMTIFAKPQGFRPNTFIVSGMAFLTGFQLIIFGYEAILYQAKTGLGKPNPVLVRLAKNLPYLPFVLFGLLLSLVGLIWCLALIARWAINGAGYFYDTQDLVIALTAVVLGIQMLSTLLFLLLFTTHSKF